MSIIHRGREHCERVWADLTPLQDVVGNEEQIKGKDLKGCDSVHFISKAG